MAQNQGRDTRSAQRDAARAKAREIREANKKSEARRRYGFIAGLTAAVLVLGGLIGFAVVSNAPAPSVAPSCAACWTLACRDGSSSSPETR